MAQRMWFGVEGKWIKRVCNREREKINDYDLDIILVTFLVTVTPTVHINNGSMDLVYLQLELYV